MQRQIDLARKKTVLLAMSLGLYCILLLILPPMAARHGVPTMWIVLPQCALAAIMTISLILSLRDFVALRKAGGTDGRR